MARSAPADHGVVRGLANACRHRATRLVDAPCASRTLVCPYHGWTYDLTGALVHVPHAGAFAAADRRDLPVLPVTERHGVAVCRAFWFEQPGLNRIWLAWCQ